MSIGVRVVDVDTGFNVERETADNSGVWTLLNTFTDNQEDKAARYAERKFRKLNGGDAVVWCFK